MSEIACILRSTALRTTSLSVDTTNGGVSLLSMFSQMDPGRGFLDREIGGLLIYGRGGNLSEVTVSFVF